MVDFSSLFFWIILFALNIFGFVQFGVDKYKAKRGQWRIPENTLFMTALLGGSLGCIIGMRVFRHKTKHKSFTVGMPLIMTLQLILAAVIRNLI